MYSRGRYIFNDFKCNFARIYHDALGQSVVLPFVRRYMVVYRRCMVVYRRYMVVYRRYMIVYRRYMVEYRRYMAVYRRYMLVYRRNMVVYRRIVGRQSVSTSIFLSSF